MSIFTSARTKWRRMIQDHAVTRAAFRQLEQAMGREPAKRYLELVYDSLIGRGLKIDTVAKDLVSDLIMKEHRNVLGKRQYVASLVAQTRSGGLRTILNANLRPSVSYYKNPSAPGLAGRQLAIDKAANWICGDYVAALATTRSLLAEYIPATAGQPGKAGAALGATPEHIKRIFKRAVTGAPPNRFNYLAGDVHYPSTVGAGVLLDELFQLTGATHWPAFGDTHWESIAMFYLTSLVTIQAFPDGNKRTGHLAYAIVLIKGTHDFKAPTSAKETELFRMNG
jgi:hypothetical protein